MLQNKVKQKLRQGERVVGLFVKSTDPVIAEWVSACGPDFLVCDAEHGAASVRDFENFCRAVELGGSTPFLRTHSGDISVLSRSFDVGGMGVHIPWVDTEQVAKEVVQLTKYLPLGRRGLAGTRVSRYGLGVNLIEYMRSANEETLIVAQIESLQGLENVDAIAQVEGIDVVFVGPTDLSNAMGIPLQFESSALKENIMHVAQTARRHGKTFRIFVRHPDEIAVWESLGAKYFISNFEGLAAQSIRAFVQ